MKDSNCAYCMQGELVAPFGYLACEMETSFVYIFKEQSNPGRVIVAHKKHVSELIDLTEEERDAYFADIAKVSRAIHKAFHPNKVNYGAYGDTGCHLHFHLVPKYEGGSEWGSTFTMNSGKVMISEEQCEELAVKLRTALQEV